MKLYCIIALSLLLRPETATAQQEESITCLLYTSDAADELLCVDLGGRRIIKKKKKQNSHAMNFYRND